MALSLAQKLVYYDAVEQIVYGSKMGSHKTPKTKEIRRQNVLKRPQFK